MKRLIFLLLFLSSPIQAEKFKGFTNYETWLVYDFLESTQPKEVLKKLSIEDLKTHIYLSTRTKNFNYSISLDEVDFKEIAQFLAE